MRRASFIFLVAVVCGCSHRPTVVGQWSTRAGSGSGTLIFRQDCTFRSYTESPLASLVMDGTFELKGEMLRMHIVKWSVPKGPQMSERERLSMNKIFQTDSFSTVTWTDEDHLRISGQSGELTTAERVSK